MYQMTPQSAKKPSRLLGCLKNILLAFFALSGLFVVIVAISVFGDESEIGSKSNLAATDSRIILVPTYTPTPSEPTATATPVGPLTATILPPPTRTPHPTALPAFLARCLDVPEAMISAIENRLTVIGGGTLDYETAQAVRSGSYNKLFFIAAVIQGPGMDSKPIGIWATNDLDGGLVFAIDAMASEFSDLFLGSETDAHITQFDDGGQESEKCVQYKQDNP